MNILALALVSAAPCLAVAGLPPPGAPFAPPSMPAGPGAPVVYEHTATAGPDETFLLAGDRLSPHLMAWGAGPSDSSGQVWIPRVLFCTNGLLAAALPGKANDGVFLVWATNAAGCSEPVVLNRPEIWWTAPAVARPGGEIRVFGRNLLNEKTTTHAFTVAGLWSFGMALEPRTYGATLGVKF